MKIAIYGTELNEKIKISIKALIDFLRTKQAHIFIDSDFFNSIRNINELKKENNV